MPRLLIFALLLALTAHAQDSDRDGISDALEQSLIERFAPTFMISSADCSVAPAQFVANDVQPTPQADDGTIYAQAFPTKQGIELHYYHLWRTDCGRMGHPLDDEHVSVLVSRSNKQPTDDASDYIAIYWYAAAHEDTVCDASQITRASTIDATTHGPTVWISSGKHASFLAEDLCRHGCGGDRCGIMTELQAARIINLGEASAPMNQTAWSASPLWPGSLRQKMSRSDMPADRIARLNNLPDTDIAWASPNQRPAQAAILAGNSTVDALALSHRKTDTAISIAGDHTGNALTKSYGATTHAITKSLRSTGRFLLGGKASGAKDKAAP